MPCPLSCGWRSESVPLCSESVPLLLGKCPPFCSESVPLCPWNPLNLLLFLEPKARRAKSIKASQSAAACGKPAGSAWRTALFEPVCACPSPSMASPRPLRGRPKAAIHGRLRACRPESERPGGRHCPMPPAAAPAGASRGMRQRVPVDHQKRLQGAVGGSRAVPGRRHGRCLPAARKRARSRLGGRWWPDRTIRKAGPASSAVRPAAAPGGADRLPALLPDPLDPGASGGFGDRFGQPPAAPRPR